jgi:excinuclease UvrABC nuclease subunit
MLLVCLTVSLQCTGRYSKAMKLNSRNKRHVPTAPGIYEIGLQNNGVFQPKYVGRSADLQRRFGEHASHSSNRHINDHMANEKPVYYRYQQNSNPECAEVDAQRAHNYEWNMRTERKQCP